MTIHTLEIEQFLILQDEVSQNFHGVDISQFLSLTETVKISPIALDISQSISFTQSLIPRVLEINITQILEFEQRVARVKPIEIIDTLFLWQTLEFPHYFRILQSLNLTHDLEIQNTKGIQQDLDFTQSVIINIIKPLAFIQDLGLEQFVTFYKIDCEFVGTGVIALTEPSTISLVYGTLTLVLRNPTVGDARGIESARINQKTRAGDMILFRDPLWPQSRTLRFAFTALSETEKNRLLHFLEASLADIIILIDYEGRSWQGIIRTPIANVIQEGRCNYQAEFEFEGDLI